MTCPSLPEAAGCCRSWLRNRWSVHVALTFTALLVVAGPTAQAQPPVRWSQQNITHLIGRGQGAADTVRIRFLSSDSLRDASLWVVPALRPFVRLEPAAFTLVEANREYEVLVRFLIPPAAAPGIYEGTIHLRAGGHTIPKPLPVTLNVDYGDILVSPWTRVLSDDSLPYLSTISEGAATLTFSTLPAELEPMNAGDILVIGSNPKTPLGLLRKVVDVEATGDVIVVHTTGATIEEALENGSVSISSVLTPADVVRGTTTLAGVRLAGTSSPTPSSLAAPQQGFFFELNDVILYDRDGNPSTTSDQVRVNGAIALQPSFDFNLSIQQFRITNLAFITRTTETIEITLRSEVALPGLQRKLELARFPLTPLTVWVAWMPVVIQPVLTVNVGVDGKVSIGLEGGITQTATLTAGLRYDNGTWTPVSGLSNNFTPAPPHVTAGLNVKGFGESQLNLLIYGAVGPYATIRGFLEIDADVFRCPWWDFYGGVAATVGVKLSVLGISVSDFESPNLIGLRLLIAQASGCAPSSCPSGTVFESAKLGPIGQPIEGTPALNTDQFLAARFEIGSPTQVTHVGGHMLAGSPPLPFAAIVRLGGPFALPSGLPFDDSLVAITTFDPGNPTTSRDVLTPLSATLGAGNYALVFGCDWGGGLAGCGGMTTNNTDLPGSSYFFWNGSYWQNELGFSNLRFVVCGNQ